MSPRFLAEHEAYEALLASGYAIHGRYLQRGPRTVQYVFARSAGYQSRRCCSLRALWARVRCDVGR